MSSTEPGLDDSEAAAFDRIAALIGGSRTVAVSGHTDPDGDALGSNLGLAHVIRQRWPQVRVTSLLADDASVPAAYAHLPGADAVVPATAYDETPDLFISVDTPNPDRLKNSAAVFARARHTVAIDHHPTMASFAEVSLLRGTAASVGDVVYDFARHVGARLTTQAATCLLCAILTDTGRYQYQNTDAHALRASADLVEAGASPSQIATWVYQSATIQGMHLKALAMERLALDPTGRVAYSYVTGDDLARLGAHPEDCDSLIDVVRSVGDVDACVFLRERPDGTVRANLRSKAPWLDVSAVAAGFSGGGHRAAAGASHPGPMPDALRDVVGAVARAVAAGPEGGVRP